MLSKLTDDCFTNRKKEFKPISTFKTPTISRVFDFAYAMSFGNGGEHRNHRSGGTHKRKNGEIFVNAFQGKLSEFAVYNSLYKLFSITVPDLSTYGLGEWDGADFEIGYKKITVKSTKSFGHLLLLETADWNDYGQYIPNLSKNQGDYDFFILVRIDPSCEDILKDINAFYSNKVNKGNLKNIIKRNSWKYDIPGFVTRDEIIYAIRNGHLIKEGVMLNGKKRMDAENYYVQAGDMREISTLKDFFN